MRIDRFDLIAYGSFTDKTLDLSEGTAGLHLIYGDNEAGKSTSLRALIALLFGIPARTSDNYLHLNPKLRIGGKLTLTTGDELEFLRRKGSKGTLLESGTEKTLDDSILLPFLPGDIDENLFARLYGIDHARLISGGQELLSQSGDLGQALFSAAVGTSNLRGILAGLKNDAEELYKPRASTKVVNQAISQFRESIKRSRDSSLPVAKWNSLQKELAECSKSILEIEVKIDEKSRDRSRLDRLNRVKGALAERRAVTARIDEMREILLLPENFNEICSIASGKLQNGIEAHEKAMVKQSRLKVESNESNVRYELLEKEDEILSIYKDLGTAETAIKDRPQQDGKRRLLRNEAEMLLKAVGPELTLTEVDKLRPLTNNKKWIHGLAQQKSLLDQREKNARGTIRDLEDELDTVRNKLSRIVSSNIDGDGLRAVVTTARKKGDVEERLAAVQKRAVEKNSGCELELRRLGRFSGTLTELSVFSVPVSETLDLFEKQLDDLDEKLKSNRRRQAELTAEKRQAEQSLDALLLKGDVPTIYELNQARLIRDTGWSLIKQKYIEKKNVDRQIAQYAPDLELSGVYEDKIQLADQVSDHLRLAADQVVKRADLESRIEKLKTEISRLVTELEQTGHQKKVYHTQWTSLWSSFGIDPGSPREMKQWLLKVEKLLGNAEEARSVSQDVKLLAEDCSAVRTLISQQVAKFDDSVDCKAQSLEALIAQCEQKIKVEEAALERRRQLEQLCNNTQTRINRTREEQKVIENDKVIWAEEWNQAIEGLGLKPDAHPEQAVALLDQLITFFSKYDQSEELRKRIFGIDQVIENFENRVKSFVENIGTRRENQDATVTASQLNTELNEARETRASLEKLQLQIKEIGEEIEGIDITIRSAQEQLASLIAVAGVAKADELEPTGVKSQEKRELQKRLEGLDKELIRNGDGLSLQELESETNDSDIDALDSMIERVSFELKGLHESRDKLRDIRRTIQDEIETKDGSAAAAHASEEAEQQLAHIVSGAEQYLRLEIASLILKQRIEDYRKKNQAPILAHAGTLFAQLTLGSYKGLRDELEKDGKPILLGIRSNNDEVAVHAMSEGTRDQLYLSLRLATFEQQLSNQEPMPFIVDDILIGFDDDRTKVCLEVLAELASSTQVLLFTHHRRVLELATGIQAAAGIFNHEL